MNLTDLNVATELIPFFDISLNRHSREALASLFTMVPENVADVIERQQVLEGFTANLNSMKHLPSHKGDMEEAYEFCSRLERLLPASINNYRNFRITLFFSRKDREWLLSRAVQILLLFENIYKHYFSRLDISLYPAPYKASIRSITDVLNAFEKERSSLIEKGHNITTGEVAFFMHKLYGFYRNGLLIKWWREFFLFEAFLSIAVTSRKAGFFPARFIEKGIHITGLFHPFLKNPVRNAVHIEKNVFVLTGPNMSGKSTLLRSVSLCVYLARLGFPVPAAECHLFFADDINVFINSRDNLNGGYSHFMTEILNLKESIIAAQQGKQVFAVFDELFSGTNIDDALNILTITINGLKKFTSSYFLLSTHFYKLKELHGGEIDHAAFYYIDSRLENDVPEFTYQVKKGWSEIKFGSILFEREGLMRLLR